MSQNFRRKQQKKEIQHIAVPDRKSLVASGMPHFVDGIENHRKQHQQYHNEQRSEKSGPDLPLPDKKQACKRQRRTEQHRKRGIDICCDLPCRQL